MNYYPFHIGDYATNTRHLDLIEDAIYRRLIDLYYLRDGVLAADIDQLARLICARSNRNEVEAIVNEFFTIEDGMLKHSRCDEEIARFNDKVEKSKAAGKASAASRKASIAPVINDRSTDAQQTLNQNSTGVQPSNNQEPITNNQYCSNEHTGREGESADSPAPKAQPVAKTTSAKPKTNKARPQDLQEVISYMLEQGSTEQEANRFFDYFSANGWLVGKAKAPMKDWQAAVRSWVSRVKPEPQSHVGNTYDHQGNVVQMTNSPPVRNQLPQSKQGMAIAALQAMKSTNRGVM